jgi:voltage-gated potassium channel
MITDTKKQLRKERWQLLRTIHNLLEGPMVVLGFIWLVLLVIELIWNLTPLLELLSLIIWSIFIFDFLLRFFLAPDKTKFLRSNILTLISLVIPALRVFRLARAIRVMRTLRATRSIRLVKVVGSLNRGMRSLSASLGRRKFGYVLILTLIVLFTGAAGMYAFENQEQNGFNSFGESLWWTAMLLTTQGSEFWPRTAEGRALCFLLSVYGFTVFGYFTAMLATFFIGRDAEDERTEIAGSKQLNLLHQDVQRLRDELRVLLVKQAVSAAGTPANPEKTDQDSLET